MGSVKLEVGDVLFRFLPEYQVWHAGMVSRIVDGKSDNPLYVFVLEFDDSNKINESSLLAFMWGRKYFWRINFEEELNTLGPSVFRERHERADIGYQLRAKNQLTYSMHRYNCEYFVRRCVFREPLLWPSRQTECMSNSRPALYIKLASMALVSLIQRTGDNLEREANMRVGDDRFIIGGDGMVRRG